MRHPRLIQTRVSLCHPCSISFLFFTFLSNDPPSLLNDTSRFTTSYHSVDTLLSDEQLLLIPLGFQRGYMNTSNRDNVIDKDVLNTEPTETGARSTGGFKAIRKGGHGGRNT